MGKRVLMVGSAEQSGGGVTSVIRLMKCMPIWEKYNCYWLGTQIQAGRWTKLRYALYAYIKAFFIIWRYDVIHFHTVPNVSMKIQLPVFLLARLWKKKIILHLHCGNQLTWDESRNFQLAHYCMQKSDLIILLAKKFQGFLEDYWTDIKTHRTVLYNACEPVKALPYEQHEKYILYVGRFTDNKGGWLLIKAFAQIHKKFPEWRLLFAGDGEERPIYERLITENHLEGKVSLPGFLYGDTLADAYRKASIFALTSHYEGFPMVVLEAWQYGVPVVTTPVGGLPDVLQEDKNGCIFGYDDAGELAKKLEHLISNDALRNEMSKYCRHFAEETFSMETINKQLDELYSTI